jgi:hypothetical protein
MMIRTRQAVCVKCSHTFPLHEETSRRAHLLYCVRCGRDKLMGLAELKEYYYRYLETLINPVSEDVKARSVPVHPLFSHKLLDMRKYTLMVEHLAGSCICGAVFRFSGKPRCPKCRSVAIRIMDRQKTCNLPAAREIEA